MLFTSNIFIFLFLPCIILFYYLIQKRFRNIFLLFASLLFYAWGEPKFVLVMIGSIVFNYFMALLISSSKKQLVRNVLLILTLAGNLSILFIFKYLNFVIENINRIGFDVTKKEIVLPLGISFFTFQALSYVIDVYRGQAQVQKRIQNFGLYISFFPQLIAGPIVRYQTIAKQIDERHENFVDFCAGVKRFIVGFAKKVIIANNMAIIADDAFIMPDVERSVLYAWIGALAYMFQIFYDFSGYSDMAIGLGKMLGFHFLENFNYPYISKSVSEFWRRWHISLGQWFRDYVYFPLGGSRVKSKRRLVFNLFIVWILTGVWHGASWNFVLWGLMYFILITFEKLSGWPQKFRYSWQKTIYQLFTLSSVLLGWVLFRAWGTKAAFGYILSMFWGKGNTFLCGNAIASIQQYIVFFVVAILGATPIFGCLKDKVSTYKTRKLYHILDILSALFYLFIFFWSVSFIMMDQHNPFIYFNF